MMVKHCSVVGVLPAGRWRCVSRAVAAVRARQPNGVAGVSGDLTPRLGLRQLAVNPWAVQCQIYTRS
jgi:hypothetical protein